MASEVVVSLLKSHATTDLAELLPHKDELVATACEDGLIAIEAAKALLRIELTDHDLELLSRRLDSVTDLDARFAIYALLATHGRITPADLLAVEGTLSALSDQQQFFLGVVARHCMLPWGSPIVSALVQRARLADGGWHRHVHTLSCLLSYLDHPALFQLASTVQENIADDGLLSAVLGRVVSQARKRVS